MAQLTLPWSDMWTFYKQAPSAIQTDIIDQLNLDVVMETSSKKVRKEILEDAPSAVVSKYGVRDGQELNQRLAKLLGTRR